VCACVERESSRERETDKSLLVIFLVFLTHVCFLLSWGVFFVVPCRHRTNMMTRVLKLPISGLLKKLQGRIR
jgi:hypothetical protein